MCHPFAMLRAGSEAEPKDLASEKEILRFAQNDSFAVTLGTLHFRHFKEGFDNGRDKSWSGS
jgi:hypothetical protein